MQIIVDKAIPYLRGLLEPYAEIHYISGKAITATDVRDADALIVRTRTRCNAELLAGSRVKFIATATIGFDHIDIDWCKAHGIEVVTAAGCNARGVLQWVAAALVYLSQLQGWHPSERTLGVVGVGHVGSLVAEYAASWGFRVLCCDPPREAREHCGFLPLETLVREADMLTFHTPLDASTRHMVNERLLSMLRPDAVILNSSRGEVVDTASLLGSSHSFALDVWEDEPHIDRELLRRTLLSTPHIAGYSEQGKAQAAAMSVNALARHFGLPLGDWYPQEAAPSSPRTISWRELCATIGAAFDIAAESARLKANPEDFEQMRDEYVYRKEYF